MMTWTSRSSSSGKLFAHARVSSSGNEGGMVRNLLGLIMARHQFAPGLDWHEPFALGQFLLEKPESTFQFAPVHLLQDCLEVRVGRLRFPHHLRPLHLPLVIGSPISSTGSVIGGLMARMTVALTVLPVTVSGGRKRAPFAVGTLNGFLGFRIGDASMN
jgi:hypothetical protein